MGWKEEYDEAWEQIRLGLGDELGEHLADARSFVGDRALLALLNSFDPVEVIIATGIQICACVIGPEGQREIGAREEADREPVGLAVAAAHATLVQREGDEDWRRCLPPDARSQMMAQLRRRKAADRR